jgi:hypothetical protein
VLSLATGRLVYLNIEQVRFACLTDKLPEVERSYSNYLGLPVIYRFEKHAGYYGVMIDLPGSDCHLEFTSHANGSPCPHPQRSTCWFCTSTATPTCTTPWSVCL